MSAGYFVTCLVHSKAANHKISGFFYLGTLSAVNTISATGAMINVAASTVNVGVIIKDMSPYICPVSGLISYKDMPARYEIPIIE